MKKRLFLLIVDKAILGILIAAVAYFFSLQLQNSQLVGDYQKSLFENRLTAYKTLLTSAKQARDKCLEVYLAGPNSHPSDDIAWRRRLIESEARAKELYDSSGSRGSSWTTYDEIFEPLKKIEETRRDNALFLSQSIDKSIDQFLTTLLNDIDKAVSRAREKNPLTESEQQEAWERTQAAYEQLRHAIVESLRISEIKLG